MSVPDLVVESQLHTLERTPGGLPVSNAHRWKGGR
jgi:hypothetical protein